MYTKVYGCVWRWSSCVSVYFFIRCWMMWLYIFWYGYAQRLSIYSLSLLVHLFIVSSQNMSALGVDLYARECYIIYITGVIWNDWLHAWLRLCCRDSDSVSMGAISLRSHSHYPPAFSGRCATCLQPFTYWLLIRREPCIQIPTKLLIVYVQLCGLLCLFCWWVYSDTTYSVCLCIWLANL